MLEALNNGYHKILNYMPAKTSMFDVTFPGLTGKLIAVSTANLTSPAIESVAVPMQNSDVFVAGKNSLGDISFDIYENELGLSWTYMWEWLYGAPNSVIAPSGLNNIPILYKRDILCSLKNSFNVPFMTFKYEGCFIKSIAALDLDMSTTDVLKYNVTFSVDSFVYHGLGDLIK